MMRYNLRFDHEQSAFLSDSEHEKHLGLKGRELAPWFGSNESCAKRDGEPRDLVFRTVGKVSAMLLCIWPLGLPAQSSRPTGSVVVVTSARLPESTQMPAESMFLHSDDDGSTYLYLEQHSKNRLVILDVTHPVHISQVSTVSVSGAAFDFVRALGSSSALVCFRDNSGSGVVRFRKPKEPSLTVAPGLKQASRVEDIGTFGLLLTNGQRTQGDVKERDVQVVDLSPGAPTVLATVRSVHQEIRDSSTGAHFLLGAEGLTVVRQPDVEAQNDMAMKSAN